MLFRSATPVTLSYALINAAQDCEIVFFSTTQALSYGAIDGISTSGRTPYSSGGEGAAMGLVKQGARVAVIERYQNDLSTRIECRFGNNLVNCAARNSGEYSVRQVDNNLLPPHLSCRAI